MRALLQTGYGEVDALKLAEVDKPAIARSDDVLIRVRAASLNFADMMALRGRPILFRPFVYGLTPRNPVVGLVAAGVVESVGEKVTRFKPGDEVFGEFRRGGGCAEYVVTSESGLALKPSDVSFEEAATLPVAGITALQGMRAAAVGPGQRVIINGASGGVGTFAIQIAKTLGADVTAVCSTHNAEQARALGADEVIDYTREDFTTGGPRFDVFFDLVGNRALADRRGVLLPEGVYVATFGQGGGDWLGPLGRILYAGLVSVFRPGKIKILTTDAAEADLLELARLVETGALKPVIEKTWPLAEAQAAFEHLLDGHARGKLIVTP